MENFLSSIHQIKSSNEEKYDVLYMNTPWNKLSVSQMSKLSIKDLAKENSLLYMWADTYTLADAISLINTFGYKFESVYQVCDIASYPTNPPKEKTVTKMDVVEADKAEDAKTEGAKTEDAKTEGAKTEGAKTEGAKRVKKTRCPPLTPPKYWTSGDRGSSRNTTEYLLLAVRGDSGVLTTLGNEKTGTLPYQVVRHPEMGKKSRSVPKKNVFLDTEWCVDRPIDFMDNVRGHLKPDVKMLEIFGSSIRDDIDGLGPNIPGGFCPGYNSNKGITGALNKCLRTMKKVQLQNLVSSLTKMAQTDDRDTKVQEFKKVEDTWKALVKALADLRSDISYDWSNEDADLPADWMRIAVLFYATKNVSDFGNLRRRRKKRKTQGGPVRLYGIAAARSISDELTEFLGLEKGTLMSRTTVIKKLNEYVKEKKLQNPEKKIEIIPDEKLGKILNVQDEHEPLTYFTMSKLITHHFPPTKAAEKDKENSKKVVEKVESTEEQGAAKKQKITEN